MGDVFFFFLQKEPEDQIWSLKVCVTHVHILFLSMNSHSLSTGRLGLDFLMQGAWETYESNSGREGKRGANK